MSIAVSILTNVAEGISFIDFPSAVSIPLRRTMLPCLAL